MSSRPRNPSNADPRGTASRSWRASLIRSKPQMFGGMEAPSREAGEPMMARRVSWAGLVFVGIYGEDGGECDGKVDV
jgi:hypothetical protein